MEYDVARVDTLRVRWVFLPEKNTTSVHLHTLVGLRGEFYKQFKRIAMTHNEFFIRKHFSNFVV